MTEFSFLGELSPQKQSKWNTKKIQYCMSCDCFENWTENIRYTSANILDQSGKNEMLL